MLSGETAAGAYLIRSVTIMDKIIRYTEGTERYRKNPPIDLELGHTTNTIARRRWPAARACRRSARWPSTPARAGSPGSSATTAWRVPIYAFTPNASTYQSLLALYWGVTPILFTAASYEGSSIFIDLDKAILRRGLLAEEDRIVIAFGYPLKDHKSVNLLKLHKVGEKPPARGLWHDHAMTRLSRRRVTTGLAALAAGCRVGAPPAKRTVVDAPPRAVPPLTLVTYNVLADRVRVSERLPPLLELLARADADVIALQEVTDWIARLIHEQPWARGYYASTIGGRRAHPGGQYILSRRPILRSSAIELAGRQRRTAVLSTIEAGGVELTVVTTHLESFLEDGPTRARQLDQIFERLQLEDDATLLGDLNFGDGEPEEARVPAEYVDLWRALRPDEPGFTWDIERSEMARVGSFPGEPSRRLDRIYLRSQRTRGRSIEIIGDQPVHPGRRELFPSDHFGLAATLEPVSGS
ncbi:MAG: endonuclease/exonuclease/phosphatase family protein [Nannocystaceae bacterium]